MMLAAAAAAAASAAPSNSNSISNSNEPPNSYAGGHATGKIGTTATGAAAAIGGSVTVAPNGSSSCNGYAADVSPLNSAVSIATSSSPPASTSSSCSLVGGTANPHLVSPSPAAVLLDEKQQLVLPSSVSEPMLVPPSIKAGASVGTGPSHRSVAVAPSAMEPTGTSTLLGSKAPVTTSATVAMPTQSAKQQQQQQQQQQQLRHTKQHVPPSLASAAATTPRPLSDALTSSSRKPGATGTAPTSTHRVALPVGHKIDGASTNDTHVGNVMVANVAGGSCKTNPAGGDATPYGSAAHQRQTKQPHQQQASDAHKPCAVERSKQAQPQQQQSAVAAVAATVAMLAQQQQQQQQQHYQQTSSAVTVASQALSQLSTAATLPAAGLAPAPPTHHAHHHAHLYSHAQQQQQHSVVSLPNINAPGAAAAAAAHPPQQSINLNVNHHVISTPIVVDFSNMTVNCVQLQEAAAQHPNPIAAAAAAMAVGYGAAAAAAASVPAAIGARPPAAK
ncbi:hormone receptor 4-like [Anopheles arabiensis]|uniref:hormone receptor 4-like n=1 Tax=Anopheles arabiensis TaxID=7173 RepID=UPI001AAD71D8|nr:hormone receptor 4-like [Anopheles arabiensis]